MKAFELTLAVGLLVAFFMADMVFAQGQGGQGPPRLGCQQRFDSLDANHDGKLTKDEFMAGPHRRNNPEKVFESMDVNGHGYLTKEEFCTKGPGGGGMGKGMRQGTSTGTNQ